LKNRHLRRILTLNPGLWTQSAKNVQKKVKKMLTSAPVSVKLTSHTVKIEHNTTHKMRTHKLLLTAAAMLAAGIVSSQADSTVYSQNIVGYANVVTAASTTYAMTVPFVIGVSNGANEIWPFTYNVANSGALPDYSQLLIWTGTGYNTYLSDATSPCGWDDLNYNPLPGAPKLPIGQAFFLTPFSNVTNTFAGVVAVNVGTSNKMTLAGSTTYFVAPTVPYGGAVTNGNLTTGVGGANLWSADGTTGLPDYSQVLIWTGTGYNVYISDHTSPSYWDDLNYNALSTPPALNVGQGFFLTPFATFDWTVGL
jgi:hypothetical protein